MAATDSLKQISNSFELSMVAGGLFSPLLIRSIIASNQWIARMYKHYFYFPSVVSELYTHIEASKVSNIKAPFGVVYRDYVHGSALWIMPSKGKDKFQSFRIFWIQSPDMNAFELLDQSNAKYNNTNASIPRDLFVTDFIETVCMEKSSYSSPFHETFAADLFLHMMLNDMSVLKKDSIKTTVQTLMTKLITKIMEAAKNNDNKRNKTVLNDGYLKGLFAYAKSFFNQEASEQSKYVLNSKIQNVILECLTQPINLVSPHEIAKDLTEAIENSRHMHPTQQPFYYVSEPLPEALQIPVIVDAPPLPFMICLYKTSHSKRKKFENGQKKEEEEDDEDDNDEYEDVPFQFGYTFTAYYDKFQTNDRVSQAQ